MLSKKTLLFKQYFIEKLKGGKSICKPVFCKYFIVLMDNSIILVTMQNIYYYYPASRDHIMKELLRLYKNYIHALLSSSGSGCSKE